MSGRMNLFFNFQGTVISVQCCDNDSLRSVFNKYCTKAEIKLEDAKFYHNGKEVAPCDKTLFALQLSDRSTFNVVLARYVIGA